MFLPSSPSFPHHITGTNVVFDTVHSAAFFSHVPVFPFPFHFTTWFSLSKVQLSYRATVFHLTLVNHLLSRLQTHDLDALTHNGH